LKEFGWPVDQRITVLNAKSELDPRTGPTMSYRAFKRLLGETSLERKCRFLLGTGILVLMTFSFWIYAHQTEILAFEQTQTTGRLLINPIVARLHVTESSREAMEAFQDQSELTWPEVLREYRFKILKPKATRPEHKSEGEELEILNRFVADNSKTDETRTVSQRSEFYYYGAIRASQTCLNCHNKIATAASIEPLKEGDLMAVVSIRLSTREIESGVHLNRALLISTALVTSILIMAGAYLIIRYVIVKPVKHLKDVSDAIAAGHLNVRSEIHTGDEFEDLSEAFNRMLRNLMSMQERYQRVNTDLDKKVDELAKANLALYESNKAKGDFLATVSHELRTPLNSILGFSDLLTGSGTLSEKQARWSTNIKSSGQQLQSLINDILNLAKIEAGKMEIKVEPIALPELGESLLAMFRPLAEKKLIELRSQWEAKMPILEQDPFKVRQILQNLISNAIKFTPEGGTVTLKMEAEASDVLFRVIDTGVGIAPEDQDVIFEKFRQIGNPMTREYEGTGLGLSIVRELAQLLGGEVSLKSELGRGSVFTVRLPFRIIKKSGSNFDITPREIPSITINTISASSSVS
jgi:two-component system, NarL family, sensor histidine kinase BarA